MKTITCTLISLIVLMTASSPAFAVEWTETDKETARLITLGGNRFAIDLYGKLATGSQNMFVSPYSISTALAMTYLGAAGSTELQMARTLHYPTASDFDAADTGLQRHIPIEPDRFARLLGQINTTLNEQGEHGGYQLNIANALWPQIGYEFRSKYLDAVRSHFDAELRHLDFITQTSRSRETINAWVEKKTRDKIKDLIPQGALDATTRMVLTNAIYFKGNWNTRFKAERTKDAPFTLLDGDSVSVPMMNQTEEFRYAETDDFQLLDLPYVNKDLSMIILLPRQQDGLPAIEKQLTSRKLTEALAPMRKREVIVSIPKFKMSSRFSLASVLQSMGMTDAFTRSADFSRMTGGKDLFISDVLHKAYVDVNEEGTEAAAATGVVMKLLSVGPVEPVRFTADHPFMFLIRDNHTGSILFLGRVMNPDK